MSTQDTSEWGYCISVMSPMYSKSRGHTVPATFSQMPLNIESSSYSKCTLHAFVDFLSIQDTINHYKYCEIVEKCKIVNVQTSPCCLILIAEKKKKNVSDFSDSYVSLFFSFLLSVYFCARNATVSYQPRSSQFGQLLRVITRQERVKLLSFHIVFWLKLFQTFWIQTEKDGK